MAAIYFFVNLRMTQVAFGHDHGVWLRDGSVYTSGDNAFGQLLRREAVETFAPTTKRAEAVVCDEYTTYLLTEEGVYQSGPYKEVVKGPVRSFDVGNNFTAYVNATGEVYHSHKGRVPLPAPAVKVQCGENFTACLLEDGRVYSFGQGDVGQLGTGSQRFSANPVLNSIDQVQDITKGTYKLFYIRQDGTLYVTGAGEDGDMGLGKRHEMRTTPTRIYTQNPIVEVACGTTHSLFLDDTGLMHSTGSNLWGQNGGARFTYQREVSVEVPLVEAVVHVYAGYDCSAAITESGVLYVWGRNDLGQLGVTDQGETFRENEYVFQPYPLP